QNIPKSGTSGRPLTCCRSTNVRARIVRESSMPCANGGLQPLPSPHWARPQHRKIRRWLPLILWTGGLNAQTCLTLSPATLTTDGTALMDLSIQSPPGREPAAIQWTIVFDGSAIRSLAVDALTSAEKTAICIGEAA